MFRQLHRCIPQTQNLSRNKVLKQWFRTNASRSQETELMKQINARISAVGPITIADYMNEVLCNPVQGYYMNKDVFGVQGDFITSPEISQIFGELVAIWFVHEWIKMGQCKPLQVVELGPGRGTLADDMLRVMSKFESLQDSVSLHLVEMSPHLCQIQESTLCEKVDTLQCDENNDTSFKRNVTRHNGVPVYWYRHVSEIPKAFTCYVAHEFFDALPIHKFVKTNDGYREVLIDLDLDCNPHRLRYVKSNGPTPASKLFISPDETRDEFEVSPKSGVVIQEISKHIKENGGCALIADYGHSGDKFDTFRAFRNHELHDPLSEPGTADLTADVDFSYLGKMASEYAMVLGPITQTTFLKQMGIDLRMKKLSEVGDENQKENLRSAYNMLTKPENMGERFKFMAIFPEVMRNFFRKFPPACF